MSLGLSFRGACEASRPGLLAGRVSEAVLAMQGPFGCAVYQHSPTQITVEFCPMGLLEMRIDGDVLEGEAATTPAGPGFHKAVVEFLDGLAREAGLLLEVEDETGYWTHRDFDRLTQEQMGWLRAVIRQVSSIEQTTFRITWPLDGWEPAGRTGIVTPMGHYTHAQLRAELERDDLRSFAQQFFIWINPERDALYHRAVALYLMWNECRWVKPRTEAEEAVLTEIFYALKQARAMDATLPLPMTAWIEVVLLAGGRPAEVVTAPDLPVDGPIGYRRGDVIQPFPGGWRAVLPGAILKERDEDGGIVYWEPLRNFRLTAFRHQVQAGEDDPARRLVPEPTFDEMIDGYRYRSVTHFDPEESAWMLQGVIAGPGGMALSTITWTDERHAAWAEQTFRSIQPPPLAPD